MSLRDFSNQILDEATYQKFLKQVLPLNTTEQKEGTANKLTLGLYQRVSSKNISETLKLNSINAKEHLKSLNCEVSKKSIQSLMVPLQKILRNALDGLYVSQPGMD